MAPFVDGLRRPRGGRATAIDLPQAAEAEDAAPGLPPRRSPAEPASPSAATRTAAGSRAWPPRSPTRPYAALVLFSYPLHPPGTARPGRGTRSRHWPSIRCPVLLLSGEADPFARIELLRAGRPACCGRPSWSRIPRLGHTLKPVLEDVLDRAAAFLLAHACGGRPQRRVGRIRGVVRGGWVDRPVSCAHPQAPGDTGGRAARDIAGAVGVPDARPPSPASHASDPRSEPIAGTLTVPSR